MMSMNKVLGALVLVGTLVACGQGGQVARTTKAIQTPEEAAALAFLNDRANTTFEVLDVDCALRSDTARQIIKHLDGQDQTPGTADDNPIDSITELDDVNQVGPWSIEQIKLCADSFGYTPTPYELAVVNFLNDPATDFERLDVDCALYSDAADNLISARAEAPFHSLAQVDAVDQVGPATLDALGQCASAFGFDAGDPDPDPQECVPQAWEDDFDTEESFWDPAQVPELTALMPSLEAAALAYEDPNPYLPRMQFAEILRYSLAGEVVHYEVRFVQTIDPECGVQLHVRIDLDSCLNQVDLWAGI